LDYPCPERLKPNLPWMAKHLAVYGELTLNQKLRQQLANISISTINRLMKKRGKTKAKLTFRESPS